MEPTDVRQANERAVRTYFDRLLNARDLSVCDELLAPTYVDHDAPPDAPRGPEPVKAFMRGFLEQYPNMRVTIHEVIADDRRAAFRAEWRGTHRDSGAVYHCMGIVILHLDAQGRFLERWSAYAPVTEAAGGG